jgi:hypothetical protein
MKRSDIQENGIEFTTVCKSINFLASKERCETG